MLSTRTSEKIYLKTYKNFKDKYPQWMHVFNTPISMLSNDLYPCGLSNQKATRLKGILEKIIADFGSLNLENLKSYNDDELENYLISLPGVGLKMARCIMLYSFDRASLPVDTHTRRISKRLGLIQGDENEKTVHTKLDQIIPSNLRFSYHVNCLCHGREVCKSRSPLCHVCNITKYCKNFSHQKSFYKA